MSSDGSFEVACVYIYICIQISWTFYIEKKYFYKFLQLRNVITGPVKMGKQRNAVDVI